MSGGLIIRINYKIAADERVHEEHASDVRLYSIS